MSSSTIPITCSPCRTPGGCPRRPTPGRVQSPASSCSSRTDGTESLTCRRLRAARGQAGRGRTPRGRLRCPGSWPDSSAISSAAWRTVGASLTTSSMRPPTELSPWYFPVCRLSTTVSATKLRWKTCCGSRRRPLSNVSGSVVKGLGVICAGSGTRGVRNRPGSAGLDCVTHRFALPSAAMCAVSFTRGGQDYGFQLKIQCGRATCRARECSPMQAKHKCAEHCPPIAGPIPVTSIANIEQEHGEAQHCAGETPSSSRSGRPRPR